MHTQRRIIMIGGLPWLGALMMGEPRNGFECAFHRYIGYDTVSTCADMCAERGKQVVERIELHVLFLRSIVGHAIFDSLQAYSTNMMFFNCLAMSSHRSQGFVLL